MCPPTGEMDGEESERPTAGRDVNPGEAIPPYAVTDGSQFGRRRFLRVLGLGTLAVVPVPILPELMRVAGLAEGQPHQGHDMGEPARARDGRLLHWTIIIYLPSFHRF